MLRTGHSTCENFAINHWDVGSRYTPKRRGDLRCRYQATWGPEPGQRCLGCISCNPALWPCTSLSLCCICPPFLERRLHGSGNPVCITPLQPSPVWVGGWRPACFQFQRQHPTVTLCLAGPRPGHTHHKASEACPGALAKRTQCFLRPTDLSKRGAGD